ncbi:MAG: TetR/AcrR family transcriptional regulator [Lachnospiraceae bacterium]|nr:TetR/AcrR family transcriptional regulator [Lachnospiraceae bacterium]
MPRLKGDTKTIILEEALKLFAVKGFEAVSVREIADKVGIGNSALYKHYESKQAIFDALVVSLKERYLAQSSTITSKIRGIDELKKQAFKMFEYQTKDPLIVQFRQMLLIEQFRNPQMAEIYKEFFVDIPINREKEIFEELQEQGLMVKGNARVYAMEFYAPFYLYHFVEHDEEKLLKHYKKHLQYFFEEHFIKESK